MYVNIKQLRRVNLHGHFPAKEPNKISDNQLKM